LVEHRTILDRYAAQDRPPGQRKRSGAAEEPAADRAAASVTDETMNNAKTKWLERATEKPRICG
jgi:hypothetical protein